MSYLKKRQQPRQKVRTNNPRRIATQLNLRRLPSFGSPSLGRFQRAAFGFLQKFTCTLLAAIKTGFRRFEISLSVWSGVMGVERWTCLRLSVWRLNILYIKYTRGIWTSTLCGKVPIGSVHTKQWSKLHIEKQLYCTVELILNLKEVGYCICNSQRSLEAAKNHLLCGGN